MSGIIEIVDTLESRLKLLLIKYDNLEKANRELEKEIQISKKNFDLQNSEITALKDQIHSLKMVNSLLGSEDYKRDTKLKINSLIREIDHCITQLSD